MIPLSHVLRGGLLASAVALAGCGSMMKSHDGSMSGDAMSGGHYTATLSSAAEVPTNASTATGSLDATLDKSSGMLKWKLSYSGLTGPASAAHFHGPALPGANAGVQVPIAPATSPAQGQAKLTAAQVADLEAGKWYVNVHTAAHPGGEIRGQLISK